MEIDLINAATGYFPTYNIPGAPLGAVIKNLSAGYDQLTIVSFDPTIVAHPTAATNDTTSGTMTVTPVGINATALAAGYNWSAGNPIELMIFSNTVNASSGMPYITTFPLTAAGTVSGSNVIIHYTPNVTPVAGTPGTGTWLGDPLYISSTYGISDPIGANPGILYLSTNQYDQTDWVLKVNSVVYSVNPATAELTRTVNGGTPETVATNIFGFKVGTLAYGTTSYTYISTPGSVTNNPSEIRSLRVSFIGHTAPDPSAPFRNSVDGGPYRVEATSFIINPRNMSIHDN
jgi:hypothetical protein